MTWVVLGLAALAGLTAGVFVGMLLWLIAARDLRENGFIEGYRLGRKHAEQQQQER